MRGKKRYLAALWLAVALAMLGAGQRWAALDARLRWEAEVREEVEEAVGGYALRDSAAWAADERRREARAASLRRQRETARIAILLLPLAGVAATLWILRRR